MRKALIIAGFLFLIACNSSQTKDEISTQSSQDSTKSTLEPAYVLPVNYGPAEMGDIRYTQTIVSIWKDFDEGNVLKQKDNFADTAEFHTWDGYAYRGTRDSVMMKGQEYRNSFAAVSSSVNGIISFKAKYKPTGNDDNWVAIWGQRVYTDKKGKKDTVWLHEAWKVNNDGKVDCLYQFTAKTSPINPN